MKAGARPRGTGRPRGRPPGSGNTRESVLEAARRVFTERGYDGASLRLIGATAGVDPGMVRHFFGDKEGLFREAMRIPFDPAVIVPTMLAGAPEAVGERLVRFFLSMWESESGPTPFIALMRSATSHERSAAMLREFLSHALIGRVAARLDRPEPQLRATFVASQLVGLGFVRYVAKLEPLASASHDRIVAALAPTVQRYLTGAIEDEARRAPAADRPPPGQ